AETASAALLLADPLREPVSSKAQACAQAADTATMATGAKASTRKRALVREANEQIRKLALRSGTERRLVGLVCECWRAACRQPIAASLAEYEALRRTRLTVSSPLDTPRRTSGSLSAQ